MAKLNRAGRSFARSLIADGKVDKTTAWSFTAEDGNKLLGDAGNDWTNYGRNHLGADPNESFDTKDHWKYPFAKDDMLFRSALVAIRQRTSSTNDKEVFDAAGALLDEIDGNSDRQHQNDAGKGPAAENDTIRITARPPRVEVEIRASYRSAPAPQEAFARWSPGIVAQADTKNVIKIMDVIGYDFWSGGGITGDTISEQLAEFGGQDVEIHVNSPGGDMFEGIAIYNLLRDYPGNVTVKVMALAASAASIIAMAGDTVQIGQGAFIMIHNCWVIAMGNQFDFREVADYLSPFDTAMRDIYVARTGGKASEIDKWMQSTTYFSASEAIDNGFADDLIAPEKISQDAASAKRMQAAQSAHLIESSLVHKSKMALEDARSLIMNACGDDREVGAQATRKIEAALTQKGGMSRSNARSQLAALKAGKPGAAGGHAGGKLDAAANTKLDAGGNDWIASAIALAQLLKK